MHDRTTTYHGSEAWRRRQEASAYRETDVDPVALLRARLDRQDRKRRRIRWCLDFVASCFVVGVGYVAWCVLK
jgi:hypothetical protein